MNRRSFFELVSGAIASVWAAAGLEGKPAPVKHLCEPDRAHKTLALAKAFHAPDHELKKYRIMAFNEETDGWWPLPVTRINRPTDIKLYLYTPTVPIDKRIALSRFALVDPQGNTISINNDFIGKNVTADPGIMNYTLEVSWYINAE